MIHSRQVFLTTFFASLEANGVRYSLLRNYDNLYADTATDVDVVVSEYSVGRFERCLREAAERTGFRFVHAARYVNYSQVYWHPLGGFLRLDYETEVRWRLFNVLSARQVLDARRRHGEFFIPHPAHESVILYLAAIGRGVLSKRYRQQLARLHTQCADKNKLQCALIAAFGEVGGALAEFQAQAAARQPDSGMVRRVRLSLMWQTFHHGRRLAALGRNTVTDFRRLGQRLARPAGISLLFVSSNARPRNLEDLMRGIDFLFPSQKCIFQTFDLSGRSATEIRGGPRLRWLQVRTLFKGGLFVLTYRLAHDADLSRAVRQHARCLYSRRTIVCAEDSAGRLYFGHVSTGFMVTSEPSESPDNQDFSQLFIEFISDLLQRSAVTTAWGRPRRGLLCALVGLDGAGKTTLARNLCELAGASKRFSGVRYFHWRPKVFEQMEFPLPEFRNLPRKTALVKNPLNSVLSTVRLARNALLVQLAWWFTVRPLLRQGCLVLVDRYFYNYRLDPASVKFAGSSKLLQFAERLFPPPDVVVTLAAPPEILLARKQELSEAEIRRQSETLAQMKFNAGRVIVADASLPAGDIARNTMSEISKAAVKP